MTLFALELANLVLWSTLSAPQTAAAKRVSVGAAALSLADAVAIGLLLYSEHSFSNSPSTLLSIYLSVTVLFGIAITRSLFLRESGFVAVAALAAATTVTKALLLVLEEIPTTRRSQSSYQSKEQSRGFWNRSTFWWLNETFRRGYRSLLGVEDLATVDERLDSHRLVTLLRTRWDQVDKSRPYCLAYATIDTFRGAFSAAIIPRLCYTGFSFAQPFLIHNIVDTIGNETRLSTDGVVGGLIGATALVYLGLAVSLPN